MDKKKSEINHNSLKICVLGLGYVGLPLAIEFSKTYSTIGFDINLERINQLKSGYDQTLEVTKEKLNKSSLCYATDLKEISDCNVYIITVPTPIDKSNNPEMSALTSATKIVGSVLSKDDIVIYESTVYPGATEEFCVPILEEESKLQYNFDFYCGYSPERINPGDKKHNLTSIIKVTSGSNKATATFVDDLYKSIIPIGTFKAPSIKVAEAAKVIENIQRDVNIALINELSKIFHQLDINTNEVLKAAESKWNFMPFKPGLVGGHCIGVDPYYLTYKAIKIGYTPEIILSGRQINESMSKYISDSTISEILKDNYDPSEVKIAVLGLTFKENCPDLRNTKVLNVIKELEVHKCNVIVADPCANSDETKDKYNIILEDLYKIENLDVIILAVAHNEYKSIPKHKWESMFFDKKGIFIDVKSTFSKSFFIDTDIKYWSL